MKRILILLLLVLLPVLTIGQTKAGGIVYDDAGSPIPFANVVFAGSTEGTITNEDGRFYIQSDATYTGLKVSFVGFQSKEVALPQKVNYDLKITLGEETESLSEVVIYTGKQSKKNNPAIDILRKIWENKRSNGLSNVKQYQYDKYEKVEFDLNTIDSALINSKIFNKMEFIFDQMDTSRITGKTYLPIFINERSSKVYGDNILGKEKEELEGNRNSGFSTNQTLIAFIQELYNEFNIYDNYLKFFDKSFVSPLSTTGIDTYNYVLADSTFIKDKWCYNIIYYPRRSNELTFKGDFWVNDTTWAIKEINLQVNKSANINWVKEIYIEQEYDVLNDSVFLITRDYFLSDFSLRKKEGSRGIYGKRTTLYDNYTFDKKLDEKVYDERVSKYDEDVYTKGDDFWEEKRLEPLSKDEKGVYVMLDSLKKVPKFQRLYDAGAVLVSGYYEWDKANLDIGPVFSALGFNDVEGLRVRLGARTYFDQNDPWRLEGFGAYGFKDDKFKFGISGKILLDNKARLIVSGGYRQDIEQIAASLTTSTDVLGRNLASSSLVTVGNNDQLTSLKLANFAIEAEFLKNLIIRSDMSYRTLKSASPTFNLDYFTDFSQTEIASEVKQTELVLSAIFEPGKRTSGYGVERTTSNEWFPTLFLGYTKGVEGLFNSDFDYEKLQFSYRQPWRMGGLGTFSSTIEAGKTFGEVPLGLLSVIPGNQNLFSIYGTFPQLNYYEFVTDTYATLHLEHNFGGRLFGKIPLLKKLNLREIIGFRGAWGEISNENQLINASNIRYIAPDSKPYYEYSFGVGNILKILRIDFNFRGNYLEVPDARKFGVTGALEFSF
ncbi:DUF5686 and carboxypeptidase-like regulatory domain-containing protein [Leeuwenhoekiella aequorea]|uniref:Carboxypeptidase-like protein n=1 Tax=Leeuwenhoekiella aequorea TaxID=283736 RepID=A0A4Q0P4H1_9FLAO|nr:DUF5686 and carboxypeptidase-like regulatory domain-containing protein [Leeuwenhoekiella aequorea]RXG21470.1 carboxypeptidase-like protein [Leeuwenhoekiella aequorea]